MLFRLRLPLLSDALFQGVGKAAEDVDALTSAHATDRQLGEFLPTVIPKSTCMLRPDYNVASGSVMDRACASYLTSSLS